MNVLVLGSGGREHALCWKMTQSDLLAQLYCAPGNAGTNKIATNVELSLSDFEGIGDFCINNDISIVLVGPEQPLVEGIWDFFQQDRYRDIKLIGPSKEASQLEGSKDYAKRFMERHDIPTASHRSFTKNELDDALTYIDSHNTPIVLKADGLAAGKGVLICESQQEAKVAISEMMDGKFGNAGDLIVIEEFLDGIEFSVFVLMDDYKSYVLPMAKDYKRIGEGDTGLNTGGMGAVSPVPFVHDDVMKQLTDRIINPTVDGIRSEKLNYTGFVFIGLILVDGLPHVIEYNCRMGDPETQVVMSLLESDLLKILSSLDDQSQTEVAIEISKKHGHTLVLASGGYPEKYEKGKLITGIDEISNTEVFFAGVKEGNRGLETSGGRVMALTCVASSQAKASSINYTEVEKIQFAGKYFRRDIGMDIEKFS